MNLKQGIQSDNLQRFLLNFICAGLSAFILSISHFYSGIWFVSLFALVPFLWRVIRTNMYDSIILGVILGGCYIFIIFPNEAFSSPLTFLFRFFSLSFIFSVFGLGVNRVNKYFGLNPVIIAALWLPLEYLISNNSISGNIFVFTGNQSGVMARFASLFGFLMVSFVIVLINSLILIIINYAGNRKATINKFKFIREKIQYHHITQKVVCESWYCLPELRGPPCTD
ncbi:MAG: hypothetical protein J7K40_02920 [candidate division Zixibacteria bacterium]|nr:hypothetical protein [candidate division Zixibacteria bacterium]